MRKAILCLLVLVLVAMQCTGAFAMEQTPGWELDDPLEEYAFTFAFVGDTQSVARYHPDKVTVLYDWLVENADAMNLKLVAGLGDITDTSDGDEWFVTTEAISKLRGVVPYTVVRGNHDDVDSFDAYFNDSHYTGPLNYTYDGVLNSYYTFHVGTIKYLILNLDFGPSSKTLEWGCNVLKAYPNHTAIIVTHGYIDAKGVPLTPQTSRYAPSTLGGVNDGPAIWDQLVRKFPNISMVVCGHISHPVIAAHEAIGDHGNSVWQVLADPQEVDRVQGPGGYVALMHFSSDGKHVQVENFATIPGQRFGSILRFDVTCTGGDSMEEIIPPEEPEETQPQTAAPTSVQRTPAPWVFVLVAVTTAALVFCIILLIVVLVKDKRTK